MCCNGEHWDAGLEKIKLFQSYFKTLHCPIRWEIMAIIGYESKGINEIYNSLIARSEKLARSNLYYHHSELRNGGIIVVSGYCEEGDGAPKKVWKLKTTEIKINLRGDFR